MAGTSPAMTKGEVGTSSQSVITGLVPVIPFVRHCLAERDGRDKPGHDEDKHLTRHSGTAGERAFSAPWNDADGLPCRDTAIH